jgi:hypothetical protein
MEILMVQIFVVYAGSLLKAQISLLRRNRMAGWVYSSTKIEFPVSRTGTKEPGQASKRSMLFSCKSPGQSMPGRRKDPFIEQTKTKQEMLHV